MRDADDPDAASMVTEAQLVPRALRSLLPNSDPEVGKRKLGQYFLVEGNFFHYNVGNPDPVLIYSKDSMHQVKHSPLRRKALHAIYQEQLLNRPHMI